MADRLFRLGRRRPRPRRPRLASSSTAATRCRCATRSISTSSPSRAWSPTRRPMAGQTISARARASASTRGCTRSARSRRCRAPPRRPAPRWCRWTPTRSTRIWTDQPAPPLAPVEIHPIGFAGELAKDKLARLAAAIAADGATHAVLTDPSSHRLGLQHPRRRRAAHAAGARLCHSRRRRHASALHGQAQAADGRRGLSDAARRPARARRARRRRSPRLPRPARGSRSTRCWRPKSCGMLVEDNGGTVVAAADPARIPRATKNAPRSPAARRPPPRRRGGRQAAVLARPPAAGHARRDRGRHAARGSRAARSARKRRCRCATSPSPPFPAPARTAPSCITACRAPPTACSATASCSCSIPARSIRTAPPTSPAPCRSAQPTDEMRERYTLVLKGMIGISDAALPGRHARLRHRRRRPHGAVEARAAITPMAPAMASAPIWRCMKARSALPAPAREKLLAGMMLSNEPGYYKEGALRHPAREPHPGHAGRADRRRRHRHARLRDADAGALRPAHAARPTC